MASKAKSQRFESEIEKFRGEANWKKAKELARQLSQKTPDLGWSQFKGFSSVSLSDNLTIITIFTDHFLVSLTLPSYQ